MERLQTGDNVVVVAGNHRGSTGKVTRVLRKTGKVIVEGVNIVKRHTKAVQGRPGGIREMEAPLDACKVMPVDPESGKPTRVRSEVRGDRKVRVAVRSGAVLPERERE